MVNYSNGKIYSDESDCFYIGSTTQKLCKRLVNHKANIKRGESKTYIDMRNHTNIRIELIEDFPCKSNDELLAREGYHIRLNRENILNRRIEGRTDQEYREDHKEVIKNYHKKYHIANREEILKKEKEYRERNREEISKRKKDYYKANKEDISKHVKEYQIANSEAISKQKKEYYKAKKEAQKKC